MGTVNWSDCTPNMSDACLKKTNCRKYFSVRYSNKVWFTRNNMGEEKGRFLELVFLIHNLVICVSCHMKVYLIISNDTDKLKMSLCRGGSRIKFSNFRKFCRPFFWVDHIDFPSSPKALKRLCFGQVLCAKGKILNKQIKKGVFSHFLKNFDQKNAFFSARAPPSKLEYWRKMCLFLLFLKS